MLLSQYEREIAHRDWNEAWMIGDTIPFSSSFSTFLAFLLGTVYSRAVCSRVDLFATCSVIIANEKPAPNACYRMHKIKIKRERLTD